MLGRCRRRVLVCDTGRPRNRWSHGVHGFLSRDGCTPAELNGIGRDELARYDTIEWRVAEVVEAEREPPGFRVRCADGTELRARKLLVATGVVDELPPLNGIGELYGRSVHHCPFCDGWEWRDQAIAIYGRGENGAGLALGLTVWSGDLVLCTDGPSELTPELRQRLAAQGIPVREERIECLEGVDGRLQLIVFVGGASVARHALFFSTSQRQASDLPARLGCRFTDGGAVATGKCEATNVPGLYVCGDASKEAQFVVVAAAEGAEAGMAISKALLEEDLAVTPPQKRNSTPSLTSRGVP
jgi:thioredoxin reductase